MTSRWKVNITATERAARILVGVAGATTDAPPDASATRTSSWSSVSRNPVCWFRSELRRGVNESRTAS